MKRIFNDFAYTDAPRENCWWDQTCAATDRSALEGDVSCDVAIVGGGFTGLSAALRLAEAGYSAVVLENRYVGWGASGRNGGFCCLGGGRLSDAALDKLAGREDRLRFRAAELAAINFVDALITRHGIEVDRHSDGEIELAHRPKDMDDFRTRAREVRENYGLEARLIDPADFAAHGLSGPFHGALHIPAGFALNPRKYVTGLAAAAEKAGAVIYHGTPALEVRQAAQGHDVRTPKGRVHAQKVIVATNGYSSEDLVPGLSARYMPTQSTVLVTRPLTEAELDAAGWKSDYMSADTRNLLHYFRLMPDRRMLFGMRGGLVTGKAAETRAIARVRRDFEKFFPAWKDVETPYQWSGMVCLSRAQMPFVGKLPDPGAVYASLCYHGNGVAMGSYSGGLVADLVMGKPIDRPYPQVMQKRLRKFELGRLRRLLMPFAYLGFALSDH